LVPSLIEINKVYHEDCVGFMNRLIDNGISIDVIVTSPPYNINKEYGSYHDNRQEKDYLSWLQTIARKSVNILKEDGSFFLNVGAMHSEPTLPFKIAQQFTKEDYKLQNVIHWIKSVTIEKEDIGRSNSLRDSVSVGHFKPIVSKRFLSDFQEYIFHFTKTGCLELSKLSIGVQYQDKTNIGRWKSATQDKRDRGNVWFIPYPTVTERRPHPAVFPEKLPCLCIKLHGIKDRLLVYDPFMGIGTTALACLSLGINYLGTEIDEQYVRIAMENITERTRYLKR
jgi:site-specific DNA-methyltransferase (adenine-specific)